MSARPQHQNGPMRNEPFNTILVVINLAAAPAGMGLALLAQVNWSLWRYVGRDEFDDYHVAWWHSIWWSIFPIAGVELLGIIAQLIWRPNVPAWMLWFALFLQLAAYGGTIFWWAPGQAHLKQALLPNGKVDPQYLLYVRTNWIRVTIFSVAGFLQIWIALIHFSRTL